MIAPAALINLARESNPEDPELWLATALAEMFIELQAEKRTGFHRNGRAHTAKVSR